MDGIKIKKVSKQVDTKVVKPKPLPKNAAQLRQVRREMNRGR